MVVTAQRRAKNLQEVPISVVAFSSDVLERGRFDAIISTPALVPSVQMVRSGPSAMFFVRGVSKTGKPTDGATACIASANGGGRWSPLDSPPPALYAAAIPSRKIAMRHHRFRARRLARLFAAFSLALSALAPPASALDLPPLLAPWQGWVMHDHREPECTRLARDLKQRVCLWPGRLALSVGARGGGFEQQVLVEAPGWHFLPGDESLWPQQLQLNGRRASALLREGRPALWLEPGDYEVRGSFEWREMPQSLPVPRQSALVDLTIGGEPVAQTVREQDRLWLRAPADSEAATTAGDSVKIEVFRRIDDDLPVTVTTLLRLSVSGKARELRLGRLLLPGMEPTAFSAPLPARIEEDGALRVQARAGVWELTLRTRLLEDQRAFRFERGVRDESAAWPAQEIWCFAANPSLRRVRLDGAPSVDPSQLDLPPLCGGASVYLLDADATLALTEVTRGDSAPPQDRLTLQRTVWLDFDSDGATLKDRVTGEVQRGRRLQVEPALQLGRVKAGGEPQLVTRVGDDGPAGVALGSGSVELEALSRVEALAQLGASGWQADFERVELQLQLPPGWMLWHAAGPDRVSASWVSQWSLWAIFLSLLVVAALFRLLGWHWALLGAAAVALVYHDELGLVLLLLPPLLVLGLLRVVERARWRGWLLRIGYGFGALLVVAILAFAVAQIRIAIYPQLAVPGVAHDVAMADMPVAASIAESAAEYDRYEVSKSMQRAMSPTPRPQPRYQPTDNVQTGPGEPAWQWQAVTMWWSGPVKAEQPLELYLTGPVATRLLHFLKVLLIAALALVLLRALAASGRPGADGGADTAGAERDSPPAGVAAALMLLALIAGATLLPPAAHAAEAPAATLPSPVPPAALLQELEERLLRERELERERNPACAPDCTAIESVLVTVRDNQLRLDLRIAVGASLAVPLPSVRNWQPRALLVDDFPQRGVAVGSDGALLLSLPRGSRAVTVEGPLFSDDVTLQFPQRPYRVTVAAAGWEVSGLNGDRLAANSLQLQRSGAAPVPGDTPAGGRAETLLPNAIRPFVQVRRDIDIDLDWRVTTTVTRVAPASGAINLTLPLLPGESVIGGDVDASGGRVRISLGSQDRTVSWQSTLPPQQALALKAAPTAQWVESWRLRTSWRWLVEPEGLVPVRNDEQGWQLWRPWPGESLMLKLSRPQAVSGATTTVEQVKLQLRPGLRSSALRAELRIVSSLGGDYPLQLGEAAQVQRVAVGGEVLTHPADEARVVLPLVPGVNRVELEWELARGIDTLTRTPQLQLDGAASNIELEIELPGDRWPLWVSGPRLGPAMLYWGVLVVMIGVALLLGAVRRRFQLSLPLRAGHWLLLFVGISTVDTVAALPVLLLFFALEARRRFPPPRDGRYYAVQVGIVLLAFYALVTLAHLIPQSLLAQPDMQVTGNGSSNYLYRWYQDRAGSELPQALVVSLPLLFYRVAMLLWSLWLAFALLRWLRWGWECFATGGAWPKGLGEVKKKEAELEPPTLTDEVEEVAARSDN